MPSPSEPGAPRGTPEQALPDADTGPLRNSPAPRRPGHPNARHLGDVCPETVVIMPFAVPLLLAMRLRKWLRRRVGRKAGNVIGKVAIIAFGGPPLLLACVIVLMIRLVLTVLSKLEQVAKAWRGA
jgi:hypothetical protein